MTSFTNLNLNPKILAALEKKGYVTPTPIQLQAIPPLLEGKDLLGIAQTGTGKTAAFALPILHNLAKSGTSVKSGCVRALILTPTRELASQIAENIEAYGKELGLRYALVYGGVSDRPQIAELQRGVDILIATPGRLLDLTNQGHIRFMQVEVLVLDEADRMLDMGFVNDIKKVIAKIPPKRQTLFFSATMPATITDLADSILTNPVKIAVTPQSTTVERIDQKIYFVEKKDKLLLLRHILKKPDATSVIVFSRTKHGADDVEDFLNRNSISCAAIHGDKDQDNREKSLNRFREGKIQVLVATDVAARGIDVPAISHVINFDIPSDPESYVHRIGRTARAGRQGVAISFCDPHDDTLLRAVEKAINYKIPVDDSHPYGNKKSLPMQQNRKIEKPRTNHSNKAFAKKPEHKNLPKKTGIFSFLVSLFKGKKAPTQIVQKRPEPQKPAPKRNDSRKDQNQRRAPERREPREERRERPAARSGAPIARTGGRKLSSGKKD
jgi:ATP-dependent RNA helicase RhlE